MGFTDDLDKHVQSSFDKRIVNHTIVVKHCDGLYRHWQCNAPGTGIDGFDVITWPGYLCYTGDMGTYVFSRTTDMVAFIDKALGDIRYVAEKCVSEDRDGIKQYYRECFQEVIDDECKRLEEELADDEGNSDIESLIDDLDAIRGEDDSGEEVAMEALSNTGMFDELPNCRYYTYRFLFCMYALRWFCDKLKETTT